MGLFRCGGGGGDLSAEVVLDPTLLSTDITYTADKAALYIAERLAGPSTSSTYTSQHINTTGDELEYCVDASAAVNKYYSRFEILIAKLDKGDTITIDASSVAKGVIYRIGG